MASGCGDDSDGSGTGGASGTSTSSGGAGSGAGGSSAGRGGTASPNGGAGRGGSAPAAGTSAGGSAGSSGSSPMAGAGGKASGGSSGSNAGGSGGQTPTGSPAVRFIGRFDTSDAAGPRFAWSGSGMVARFRGTSVGIKLTGDEQYAVLVDGMPKDKLISKSGTTPIASELADGEHTVEVYRRTEANQGEAQFLGFDFGAGELLAPPAAPDRRIEMIGDSITCGYGNEGANASCPFSPDTENFYLAYGAITARNLNADLTTIAWSGKGIVCNYGDDATSCMDPLPEYYDRTLPDRADSAWNFASWQPQVVVINLGTNDLSTNSDPSQMEFTSAYVDFLEHIRSKYADALILCTVAPLLGGTDLASARMYIAGAVAERVSAGDAKVKAFEIAPTDAADGAGCDYHPSLKTHEKMAAALTAKLETELGW